MNKDCYRVIFSKVRGMMVVVSELTKSQGKKSSADTQFKSSSKPLTLPKTSLKRLTVALLCCHSMVYTQALAATTQIQNTASNIPSSQRAALLKASNGTPIVNIRTPNSKGLSHNTYNQFDIGSNGAILNNSTRGANTQLAGSISGNQYLGKGAANTILNEVRSNKASKLNGSIEVAGQQADIIIANPSGLQIQGGGFINANRATLTTGIPKIDASGNLTGFEVKQGQIQFNNDQTGFALGGSAQKQANYVDVLARAISVNGKIQAKESVTAVSGSNRVDYDTLAATKISGTGTKPTLAVDVSTLGGIYANSIQLIGTEAGLGVKNAGVIEAGQQIRLTNTGKIENSGTLATTKKQTSLIDLEATGTTGSIHHTGSINSYGMINLQAEKDIAINAGTINKNSVSEASQLLPNTINLAAKQDITIENKATIQNDSASTNSNINISAGRNTQITGASKISSNGGVAVHSDTTSSINSNSQINTKNATLSVHSNNLTWLKDSQLSSDGDIYIGETKKAEEAGFHATAIGGSTLNAGGDIVIDSDSSTNVSLNTSVNAKNIYINSKDKVAIDKAKAINASGSAQITSNGSIDIKNLKEVNGGENIKANDSLYIESNKINIENSLVNANKGVSINSLNGNLDVSNTGLISNEGSVAALSQKGKVNAQDMAINSNSLVIAADKGVDLSKNLILTDAASISSNKDLNLDETTIHTQWESKEDKAGDIALSSVGKTNIAKSNINGQRNIGINSKGYLTLTESEIQAANNLELNTGRIYSNTQLKKKDNGSYYTEYGTKNKQNKLTAGDALVLNSTSSQYFTNTDLKGSAVLSNAKAGHALSNSLNITATGESKNLAGDINGDIQIVNQNQVFLDQRHTIDAQKDFIVQAAKKSL